MFKSLPLFARPALFAGLCLSLWALFPSRTLAQVSSYAFAQVNTNTYTPITGGTVLATATANSNTTGPTGIVNQVYAVSPAGFSFTFNNVTYTSINVNSNGYVTFGATPPLGTTTAPLSAATGYSGAASAYGRALNALFQPGFTGEIRWELLGAGTAQTLVIQWTNFRPGGTATTSPVPMILNFQIRLNETDNSVYFDYNTTVNGTVTASTAQVGLRGPDNVFASGSINNRLVTSGTHTWPTSAAGTANSSTAAYNSTGPLHPGTTLRYSFTPPAGPTTCATKTSPTNAATNVCASWAVLNWSQVADATGYRIIIDDNSDMSSPFTPISLNGTTTTSYAWPNGLPNTTYYWNVIAFNGGGDATGCNTIFSFTTGALSYTNTAPVTDDMEGVCAIGNWKYANAANNAWIVGAGTNNGGTQSMYLSNNGSSYAITGAVASTSYSYRDITIPAGKSISSLSFDWKNEQPTVAGRIRVYVGLSSLAVPVAGSTTMTNYIQLGGDMFNQTTWKNETFAIPAYLLGTCSVDRTYRIAFQWTTTASATAVPPGAIDNFEVAVVNAASMSGPYSIDPLGSGPTNFTTFRAAINALNAACVAGQITFNVAPTAFTETSPLPAITTSGSLGNEIKFVKNGLVSDPNPSLTVSGGTAAVGEAAISLMNASYITFEGINLTSTDGTIEYGFYLANGVTNGFSLAGAQNNTVKNCVISMTTAADNRAIYSFQAITPTSAANANSNNRFEGNQILNCRSGIVVEGKAAFRDLNNIVTGNTIGTASPGSMGGGGDAMGIHIWHQDSPEISNNMIRNFEATASTRTTAVRCSLVAGTGVIKNNIVYNLVNSAATSTAAIVNGISTGTAATVGGSLQVYNNYIAGLRCIYTGATLNDALVRGLWTETATNPGTIHYDHNTVQINNFDAPGDATSKSACYYGTTASPTVVINMRNNILANITPASSGTNGNHYIYFLAGIAHANGTWDYNDAYVENELFSGNRRGYLADINGTATAATEVADLATWKGTASKDINSVSIDPNLPAPSALGYIPNSADLDDNLIIPSRVAWADFDITGGIRPTSDIDPGVVEFTASNINMEATALQSPGSTGCYLGNQTVVATVKNSGLATIDFSVNPATVTVTVTRDGFPTGYSNQAIINSGTLAIGDERTVPLPDINMTTAGAYSFLTNIVTTGDQSPGDDNNTTIRTRVGPTAMPTTMVNFTGYSGTNLAALWPQWREATGATAPSGTASAWALPASGPVAAYIVLGNTSATTTDKEWIVGPKVTVTALTEIRFKMAITASAAPYGQTGDGLTGTDNYFEIRYSSDCGTTWQGLTGTRIDASNWTSAVGSPAFKQLKYEPAALLPALLNQEVMFALFATEGPQVESSLTTAIHIDDLILRNKPAQDLEVIAVAGPTQLVCGVANVPLRVTVRSTGSSSYSFTSNPVQLSVDVKNPSNVTQTYTATISTGTDLATATNRDLTVLASLDMTALGAWTVTPSITSEAAGADASNNTGATESRTIYPVSTSLPVTEVFGTSALINNFREGAGDALPLGTTASWTFNSNPSGPLGTERVASLSVSSGSYIREWIVTPVTAIPASGDFDLSFRFGISNPSYLVGTDDAFKVMISTDCGATWGTTLLNITSANAMTAATSGLKPHRYSLNAYRGQNIQVAFFANNGLGAATTYSLWLDDVSIDVHPTTDLEATIIAQPVVGCYGAATPVSVQFRNTGDTPIDFSATPASIAVVISHLDDEIDVSQTVTANLSATVNTGTIAPGATQTVSVGTANMTLEGIYGITGTLTCSADGFAANNTFGRVARAVQARFATTATSSPIFIGFQNVDDVQINDAAEVAMYLEGLTIGVGGPVSAPTQTSTDVYGDYQGVGDNKTLMIWGNNYGSTGNWLIMPKFAATASASFEFKVGISSFLGPSVPSSQGGLAGDNSISVLVSPTCGNTWTEVYRISPTQNSGNTLSTTLRTVKVGLAAFAGQNIMVALHHNNGQPESFTSENNVTYGANFDDLLLRNAPTFDLAIDDLLVPVDQGCFVGSQTIRVRVKNTSSSTRNFAAVPANVRVVATLPSTATVTYNGTINTGSVVADGFTEVNLSPTITMTQLGTYSFVASLQTADGDATNNSKTYTRTKDLIYTSFQDIDFETYNGDNLATAHPGWTEAVGTAPRPLYGNGVWWDSTRFGNFGSKSAVFEYNGNIGAGEWIISPPVTLGPTGRLTFDMALTERNAATAPIEKVPGDGLMSHDDELYVYISTNCGGVWTPLPGYPLIGNAIATIPHTGANYDYDLAAYAGQTVRVAFYAHEGTVGSFAEFGARDLFIDNIQLGTRYTNDLEVSSIIAPYSTKLCRKDNRIAARIFNSGTASATNFIVRATTVGGPVASVETTYTGTLNSKQYVSIEVGQLNLPVGTSSVTIEVIYPSDQNTSNDQRILYTSDVSANQAAPTISIPPPVCANNPATLTASGGGGYQWFTAPTGNTMAFYGPSFTTPNIVASPTTFYVRRNTASSHVVAPFTTSSGNTAATIGVAGVNFTLNSSVVIKGVYVYPQNTNTTISLSIVDKNLAVVAGPIVKTFATSGRNYWELNIGLPPGANYGMIANSSVQAAYFSTTPAIFATFKTPDNALVFNGAQNAAGLREGIEIVYHFHEWQVEVGSVCPSERVPVVVTTKPNGTWTGAASSDWNQAGNWCGGIPTTAIDVVVPSGGNQPQIISGTQNARNLTLMPGAQLQSNGTLNVTGDLAANGQNIVGAGMLNLNGAAGQSITGLLQVPNLTTSNTSGAGVTLTPGSTLRINPTNSTNGILQVATNGKFTATGALLHLRSNAQGTASLGPLLGTASFVGQLTQERYIQQQSSGWYFAGSPFSDAALNQWSEAGPRISPLNNATIFWYQESDSSRTMANGAIAERYGWRIPTSLAGLANATDGRGYRFWLRSNFFTDGSRLMHNGTPYQGNTNLPLTHTPGQYDGGGWNLVANPYPADVNWNGITVPAGVNDATYIWNRAAGQYQVFVKGSGSDLGVAVNATTNPNLIPSGSSFFVKTTQATNLTFTESAKSATTHAAYRTGDAENILRAFLVDRSGASDEIAIRFMAGASGEFDLAYDGAKLMGEVFALSSIGTDASRMAINSLPELNSRVEIPLNVTAVAGTYRVRFAELGSFAPGTTFWLQDRLLGTQWMVDESVNGYSFTVTANPATSGPNRLVLVAQPASVTDVKPFSTRPTLSVWPNPSNGSAVNVALHNVRGNKARLTVVDGLGRVAYKTDVDLTNATARLKLNLSGWASGVYTIRIASEATVLTQSLDVVR